MQNNLGQFVEKIMGITPQYIDIFGRGLPGLAGGSAAMTGAANSATDVTLDLKRETVKFARLYSDPSTSTKELISQSKKVEGFLLSEQTLGTLNKKQADQLINSLFDLIEKKK